MAMTDRELMDALEQLVDLTSLKAVLGALSAVCGEKSEHLESNWQDRHAAITWRGAGIRVGKCADKTTV